MFVWLFETCPKHFEARSQAAALHSQLIEFLKSYVRTYFQNAYLIYYLESFT